eukprot:GDKI01008489.1.p1 GENE.GDKI01008489.1~~GDKI01008489.1.p1  ORF type:complete len:913 (-),score=284.77 GDKI01008489.1:473-3148(-)
MKINPRSLAVGAFFALLAVAFQMGQTQAGVGFFRGLRDVMDMYLTENVYNIRRLATDSLLPSDWPKTSQQKYVDAQGRVCSGSVDIYGNVEPSTENQDVLDRVSKLTYTQFQEVLDKKAGGDSTTKYVSAMAPMFVIIAFGVLVILLLWMPMCACACCNCYRRVCSCCCCRRPTQPTKVSVCCKWTLIGGYSTWAVVFFVFCFLGVSYSAQISSGVKDMQCAIFKFSESVLYGDATVDDGGKSFPGTTGVINFMRKLENAFTPGSPELTQIQTNIDTLLNFQDETAEFDKALEYGIAATERVYTYEAGNPDSLRPAKNAYSHAYYYGTGIPNSDFKGAPSIYKTIQVEVSTGLIAALKEVDKTVKDTFAPGSAILTDAKAALTDSITPMKEVQNSIDDSLAQIGFNIEDSVKNGDSARNAAFIALEVVVAVLFGLGVLEMLRVFMCSKQDFPNPLGSCCGWCFYLPCAGFFLIIGGLVLALSSVTGNVCTFVRDDLITNNEWGTYAKTFNLDNQQTIDIATSCLSVKGDGDILTALQIRDKFDFKDQITSAFDGLTATQGQDAFDTTQLNQVVSFAQQIGWLFIPNVMSAPDEYKVPYEEVIKSGVQKAARDTQVASLGLINGLTEIEVKIAPFYFGIEGGVFDAAEVAAKTGIPIVGADANWFTTGMVPVTGYITVEANKIADDAERAQYIASIWWAHQKAMLLFDGFQTVAFDNASVDPPYMAARQNTPNFADFEAWIVQVATIVDDASTKLLAKVNGDKATGGDDLPTQISNTLQADLNNLVLNTVDEFLNSINCQFMLKGINGVLDGFCTGVVPGLANSAAAWVVMGVFGFLCFCWMFHVWKYLKDNIEVTQEVAPAMGVAVCANAVQPAQYGYAQPQTGGVQITIH